MYNLKENNYLQILFILSILTLGSALIIEYIFGYQPCSLCKIERIPYLFSIIILITNYFFRGNQNFYGVLLILIFSFSIIISVYHLSIEQGFISESTVCETKGLNLLTKEDILNSLQELNISCKNVAFKIFGLSLTSYNILVSILMLLLSIKIYTFGNGIKK
tara:strand:+ start:698 stop:1183 length:486 start_codon:yes stop_codon:yes gene_type:complete